MIRKILSSDRALLRLVQGLFLFNIADALLSVQLISQERILEEANPLWDSLIIDNPEIFLVTKLTMAGLGCHLLYKFREKPAAKAGILLCFSVYYLLLCGFYFFVFR